METMDKVSEITTSIKISIEEEPYIMMMQYAHEFSPKECSGVGLVEKIDNPDGSIDFNVTRVFLPLQRNSAGGTNIDDDELNKINTQLVVEGIDTKLCRFHWHSHVDMSVFHSRTDEENYDEMRTGDWAVSLVVNKRYEMLGSVHLYSPLRINVLNIDVEPPDAVDLDEYVISDSLRKIIEENVYIVQDWEKEQDKKDKERQYKLGFNRKNTYYDYEYGNTPIVHYADNLGLEKDIVMYTLLEQGEEQGLMTLIYDVDGATIVGYINNQTGESFELSSSLEFVNY